MKHYAHLTALFHNPPHTLGLFDSGIGGISILNELLHLPIAHYVYVADAAHLPYGEKSVDYLIERGKKITEFFIEQNIFTIVIACHTSSATSLKKLEELFPQVTYIDMLPLTTDSALGKTHNNNIGVMATNATIATHAHNILLQQKNPTVHVTELGCPLFVPLIESQASDTQINNAINDYLIPFKADTVDTIILGCTHYAFIQQQIEINAQEVQVISAASCCKEIIKNHKIAISNESKKIQFLTSGSQDALEKSLQKYLITTGNISFTLSVLDQQYR